MSDAAATSSPRATPAQRHAYGTLDGLRGVAALLVMFYHFGADVVFLHGYLAVDLFFAMSGFVIASAYERRLLGGGLGLAGFLWVRAIRLAPLWILGVVLGTAAAVLVPAPAPERSLRTALLALLLVPSDGSLIGAFPTNTSLWSLHVELVVNALYATLARRLTTRRLLGVAAASFAVLIVVGYRVGGVSFGTSELDLVCGYLRALVAFPIGIVLYRCRERLPASTVSPAVLFVLTAFALTGCGVAAQSMAGVPYDLVFIGLAAPAIVAIAAKAEPSERLRPLFLAAGSASYALYVLHQPLLHAARRFAAGPGGVAVYVEIGAVLLPSLVLLALAVDRWFDAPVRRWLARGPRRRETLGSPRPVLPPA